jgi:hypothetical protein
MQKRNLWLGIIAAVTIVGCSAGGGSNSAAPVTMAPSTTTGATRVILDATGALVDGGFESGVLSTTSAWQRCGPVGAAIETSVVHSGTHAVLEGSLTAAEPNGDEAVCQSVVIPAGASLTFWTRGVTNDTVSFAYQEADLRTSATGTVVDQFYKEANNANVWQQRTFDVSAFAGQTLTIHIGVHGSPSGSFHVAQYVDDVSFIAGTAPSPTPTPVGATPTPVPVATPTPVPVATPTPAPTAFACNNTKFNTDQAAFTAGSITADQLEDVCGSVTSVLAVSTTSSGRHGDYFVQLPSGFQIKIFSNLDAMAQASTDKPPTTWPWVAVGDFVYVEGRYFFDNSSSQGIDWTEDDTSASWTHTGYVAVCNSAGAACQKYW